MRPKSKTLSVTGSTAWIPVNAYQAGFNLGIQVTISVGASIVWTVSTTADDIFDTTVTPTAIVEAGTLSTGTGNEISSITVPCQAVRLNATVTSGTVTITVIQGGS